MSVILIKKMYSFTMVSSDESAQKSVLFYAGMINLTVANQEVDFSGKNF